MNLLPKIFPQDEAQQAAKAERSLISMEAKIGGQLFGTIPAGHRREFFCLDRHTWIWHEEWVNSKGKKQAVTTRYNVRPNGVLKSQNNHPYQPLSETEARNLYRTTELYRDRVSAEYNRILQAA
ncbi:MAG: hypothetical protein QFB87_02220 [Patescibacteria group bacterium]|nr:hypothetical protein [Patescibacteria group bacterium]